MNITKEDVEIIVANYVNYGTPDNFRYNGRKIKGYIFDKTEFESLQQTETDNFYVMLGSTNIVRGNNTGNYYITPIIARLKPDGDIDPTEMIYSDNPYTDTLIMDGTPVKKLIEKFNQELPPEKQSLTAGGIIDPVVARRMMDHHLVRSAPLSLMLPTGEKVLGFNLSNSDFNFLIAGANPNRLLVIPALKDSDKGDAPVIPNHLTLIFAWLDDDDNIFTVKMLDYCLPCPTACHKF